MLRNRMEILISLDGSADPVLLWPQALGVLRVLLSTCVSTAVWPCRRRFSGVHQIGSIDFVNSVAEFSVKAIRVEQRQDQASSLCTA